MSVMSPYLSLEANGLRLKRDGKIVISDAYISISEAWVTGLIGANGSGKTSLVMMLAGLISPDDGVVRLTNHRGKKQAGNRSGL